MNWKETNLGFEAELPGALFFFGKKEANLKNLASAYPDLRWSRIRQTHSDITIESPSTWPEPWPEADGHWTKTENLALLISTADCTPVLFYSQKQRVVSAVHAGWRGVANRIVPKTAALLAGQGFTISDVFLGPHIEMASFEVEAPVRDQLVAASTACEPYRPGAPGKFHVSLLQILREQLSEAPIARTPRIMELNFDTKTDLRFHSFRRDREKSGRQLSFVVLR